MNRTSYSFAILFSGLAFSISLVNALIYFQLGRPMYTMASYLSWFMATTLINLVAFVLIIMYYKYKRYRLSLIAGIIAVTAQFVLSSVVYGNMKGMDLGKYYMPVYLVSLAGGILAGISLLVNPARRRPWLKAAGVLMTILGVILLGVVAAFLTQSLSFVEVERVHQWISLGSMFIPALFVMNFIAELSEMPREQSGASRWKPVEIGMTTVGVIAIVVTLVVTAQFFTKGISAIAWHKQAPERAKRLAEPFEARRFESAKGRGTLLYRFMRPVDYDSTKEYPIVVCLHHGGTHGDDNMKQIDGSPIAQVLSGHGNRSKYPSFLFVPQCPEGSNWGGVPNLPAIDSLVFEGLRAFEKEFSIDETRRYVAGTSGGGYGSWHFICSRPEMFAAAIPVCGGTDPALAGKIVNVAVWAFHGAKDANVPVRYSRDMIEAIKKAGGDPKYTEFPDQAHNIWPQVNETPGLLEWMFAQKKL